MPKKRLTIDELAEEQLSERSNHDIQGIELHIVTKENYVHVAMRRTRLELAVALDWGKVAAIVLSLLKIWKEGKFWP